MKTLCAKTMQGDVKQNALKVTFTMKETHAIRLLANACAGPAIVSVKHLFLVASRERKRPPPGWWGGVPFKQGDGSA